MCRCQQASAALPQRNTRFCLKQTVKHLKTYVELKFPNLPTSSPLCAKELVTTNGNSLVIPSSEKI